MAANPGISLQDCVLKLNAYNTALAAGLPPPALGILNPNVPSVGSQYTGMSSFPMAMTNPNAVAAVAAAAAVNASITGLPPVAGEGGALTKPHRELYVGNIPPGITVPQLVEFLNACMNKLGFNTGYSTVVTAWISSDGHYAFVEFRTVEETNAALTHLNGMQVGAYQFKVGRPRGYTGGSSAVAVPMVPMQSAMGMANTAAMGMNNPLLAVTGLSNNPLMAGIGGTSAGMMVPGIGNPYAGSNYLMVTNLPLEISDQMVKDLVSAFGEVKTINCIKSSTSAQQSAVFEYLDPAVNEIAIKGLSAIDIIDKKLMVQRIPLQTAQLLLVPVSRPSVPAVPTSVTAPTIPNPPADPLVSVPPTKVIRLSNMTTEEDLHEDENYQDLVEDVKDECEKHGNVISVVIPRGTKGGWESDSGEGFIFVEYSLPTEAVQAKSVLAGRKFNGKIVQVVFYPEELFGSRNYEVPSGFFDA